MYIIFFGGVGGSYGHQRFIYLLKNTVKIVILLNIITIENFSVNIYILKCNLIRNLFLWFLWDSFKIFWFAAQETFAIINVEISFNIMLNIFVETDAFFSAFFDEQKFQKNIIYRLSNENKSKKCESITHEDKSQVNYSTVDMKIIIIMQNPVMVHKYIDFL